MFQNLAWHRDFLASVLFRHSRERDCRKTGVEFRHPGESRGPAPVGTHKAHVPTLDAGFRRHDERAESAISEKIDSLERGNPARPALAFPVWMPAFAGMTSGIARAADRAS